MDLTILKNRNTTKLASQTLCANVACPDYRTGTDLDHPAMLSFVGPVRVPPLPVPMPLGMGGMGSVYGSQSPAPKLRLSQQSRSQRQVQGITRATRWRFAAASRLVTSQPLSPESKRLMRRSDFEMEQKLTATVVASW